MKLINVLLFVGLIYGVSARDFFPDLDPIYRALLEASRGVINRWGVSIIESQRDNIRNGVPAIGLPSLDPLFIGSLELPLGVANLTLTDAYLGGISNFKIEYFDLKLFGLYFAFSVNFYRLEINGHHTTYTQIGPIGYRGDGNIDVVLNNITIHGIIELDVTDSNALTLKTFDADFEVAEVDVDMTGFPIPALDALISGLVGDAFQLLINSGTFLIDIITDTLTIPINKALSQVTVPDLLASVIEFVRRYNN